jgi:hypothetical protein
MQYTLRVTTTFIDKDDPELTIEDIRKIAYTWART